MKRSLFVGLMVSFLCCLLQATPCAAEPGEAKFGTGVTKDWKMVGEASEFDTNLITCGFFCTKPLGAMQVAVSIYLREEANGPEQVVARITLDVNPKWNIFLLPDIPLPAKGYYTFDLSSTTGELLANGSVRITGKKTEAKMPDQPKVDGTTIEGLFNKFKPKN